jgi:hypothetical protein
MRKMMGVLSVLSLLMAISFLLPTCQKQEEGETKAAEGQLPTYQVGDEWVWGYLMNDTTYILTEEVTGDETVAGRECYVIRMSFDPVMSQTHDSIVYTVTDMNYWADKATALFGVKMETVVSGNGQTFTSSEIYSYEPWANLFPLEIGKVVEADKTTTQYSGDNQIGDPIVSTEKYIVDSKENVTVTAGTFNCWKIIMYDGDGNITNTMWYSDQVKSCIKTTDASGNTLMQLNSYSVS